MRTSAFVRLSEMVSHEIVGRIFSSNDDMTTCGCAASIDASLVGGTPIWVERRTRRGVWMGRRMSEQSIGDKVLS